MRSNDRDTLTEEPLLERVPRLEPALKYRRDRRIPRLEGCRRLILGEPATSHPFDVIALSRDEVRAFRRRRLAADIEFGDEALAGPGLETTIVGAEQDVPNIRTRTMLAVDDA